MECLHWILGFLLLATRTPLDAAKRFYDVLGNEKHPGSTREHNQLSGWSSDENDWDEKLYPVWKRGDARWKNSWEGGCVQAVLTSDSPALVGSDITFAVNLVFPRCQKEDDNGNIVYEKNCRNDSGLSLDPYECNWAAASLEDSDWGNGTSPGGHHMFPDGKPFPRPHWWRKWNFVYVFHTLGQYYQKVGRCSVTVTLNTANVTLGPQVMEVIVFRRHGRAYIPIARVKDVYVVTDQIPVFVTMFQKNDRNTSDETFLKDLPIVFDVLIHDPSHFLNESAIYYKWNFGDNTGLFVSNNRTLNHTYTLNGTFSLNLTVQAVVPGPCPLPTRLPKPTPSSVPAKDNLLELSEISDENCHINRYGYFKTTITIVEGILEVNIIQIADVPRPGPQPDSTVKDFVVACEGTIPTEVCAIILDPTCHITQSVACSPVDVGEMCLLTVRRAFNESGMYCVNVTLSDDTSLALTSTLVSIPSQGAGVGRSTSRRHARHCSSGTVRRLLVGGLEASRRRGLTLSRGKAFPRLAEAVKAAGERRCLPGSLARVGDRPLPARTGRRKQAILAYLTAWRSEARRWDEGDDVANAVLLLSSGAASPVGVARGALVSLSCLAVLAAVIALLVYKKQKEYKPINSSAKKVVKGQGLHALLNHTRAMFFPRNQEEDPLIKDHCEITHLWPFLPVVTAHLVLTCTPGSAAVAVLAVVLRAPAAPLWSAATAPIVLWRPWLRLTWLCCGRAVAPEVC
ncbi:transmembrane glycoprotein NMB [Ctenodactylus gundi]